MTVSLSRLLPWLLGRPERVSAAWLEQERRLRMRNQFEGVAWQWPVRKLPPRNLTLVRSTRKVSHAA